MNEASAVRATCIVLLKKFLRREGATLVGMGDISEAVSDEITHLNRGIAVAVNRSSNRDTILLLMRLRRLEDNRLRARGFRILMRPPDSDRMKGKLIAGLYHLFSHKTAATCSGLGRIGKNGRCGKNGCGRFSGMLSL